MVVRIGTPNEPEAGVISAFRGDIQRREPGLE
jgi:hypothetical protein